MKNKKEVTAPAVSVGADTGQPLNVTNNSISNHKPKSNSQILETVSMAELYDTVYPSKPPLVDGLLYAGVYLFAGAPKLGKSFLMAQIAYHISRGFHYGIIQPVKPRRFTLPLKMITDAYRKGCTVCLAWKGQIIYFFLFRRVALAMDWTGSYRNF